MSDTRIPVPGEIWYHRRGYPVTIEAVTERGVMYINRGSIMACSLSGFLNCYLVVGDPS